MDIAPGSTAIVLLLGLLILFWDLLGSVYILAYSKRMFDFLLGRSSITKPVQPLGPKPSPAPVASPPPQQPPMPVPPSPPPPAPRSHKDGFYSCTRCGNTEARFVDGRLECTRCGHKE
jgi:hypothetical protein